MITYYELVEKLSFGIAYTHGGMFHADDCMATALLRMIYPGLQIIRSRDVPPEFPGLVFDEGYGEFDHHQTDKEFRRNGVPYSSLGLLWRCIAPAVWGMDIYRMIDARFIQAIDLADNGGKTCQMAAIVRSMNPTWNEDCSNPSFVQASFERAVMLCYSILQRQIECAQSELMAKPIIQDAIERSKDGVIELPKHINCMQQLIAEQKPKILIYPAQNYTGNWNVQTIPVRDGSRSQRVDLYRYDEDSVMGVKYRNPNGFLATCDDYESAKKLATLSVAA